MYLFWILAILEVALIRAAFGCAGYSFNITKLTPCGDNNVVTLSDDFCVTLDKDCNIYLTGCLHITKRLEKIKTKYSLDKPPIPLMEGTIDLCDLAEKYGPLAAEPLEKFGFPSKCPIEKMDLCGSPEKTYNIAKFKSQLGMAKGHTEVRLEADHGEAGKTCMDIGVTVDKARTPPKKNKIKKNKTVE